MNKPNCCVATRNSLNVTTSNVRSQSSNLNPSNTANLSSMSLIPKGNFNMGTNKLIGYPEDGETPIRKVTVQSIYMDIYAVTNRQFGAFVEQTGYITEAERYGWSFVFHDFLSVNVAKTVITHPPGTPWWSVVEGANWFAPEGVPQEDHWSFRRSNYFAHIGNEVRNVTENAGLLDMSAFAKARISGAGAEAFLDYLVANKLPIEGFTTRLWDDNVPGVQIIVTCSEAWRVSAIMLWKLTIEISIYFQEFCKRIVSIACG